ncbi:unnamed protein product, partial [Adineta ricciae]
MTDRNEEKDNDQEDELLSSALENTPRNVRLESFLNRYETRQPQLLFTDRFQQYVKRRCSSMSFLYCLNALLDMIPIVRCLKEY